jgi:maltodextrin utilization protein YvdJ
VELKRREREDAFRRMEIESLLVGDERYPTQEALTELRRNLKDKTVQELLDVIDNNQLSGNVASRRIASDAVMAQLHGTRLVDEESMLSTLTLRELYSVSVGEYIDATDYQITRAKEMLDAALLTARRTQW